MSKPRRMYGCLPRWVEWSIGLAMLAFLTVILWPFPRPGQRERARRTSCGSNLKQIVLASKAYAEDHGGVFPPVVRWDRSVSPYLQHEMLLRCPSDDQSERLSYGMNRDVGGTASASRADEATTIAFYDGIGIMVIKRHEKRHVPGANYAYLDGHVKWSEDPSKDPPEHSRPLPLARPE